MTLLLQIGVGAIAALVLLCTVFIATQTGKPRKPNTATDTVIIVTINLIVVVILILATLKLDSS